MLVNRNVAIVVGVLILIIILIGGYSIFSKSQKPPTNNAPVTQNKPVNSGSQTIQGTIKSLLTSGKSQKCTYSSKIESTSVSGTVYVANGKMRGDFSTISEQSTISGHMIIDSGFSYIWTDMNKQGIKMAIDQQQLQQPSGAPANNQTPDINKTFNYACQGWAGDGSMFNLPSDITFSTFTLPAASSSSAAPANKGTNSLNCSVCDNLPAGTARDTCKTQLKCN
jgi:hypothetical protein